MKTPRVGLVVWLLATPGGMTTSSAGGYEGMAECLEGPADPKGRGASAKQEGI
jgi:hypothetical protein